MRFTIGFLNNKLALFADGVPLPGLSDIQIRSYPDSVPTLTAEFMLQPDKPSFTFEESTK